MELHQRIRMVRLSKNLTQVYVADELGIDVANYSRLERGETKIATERLIRLAEILEVDPSVFFQPIESDNYNGNNTIELLKQILIELKDINRKL
jgi:transcriptional regulator with XRE-family HTH domain